MVCCGSGSLLVHGWCSEGARGEGAHREPVPARVRAGGDGVPLMVGALDLARGGQSRAPCVAWLLVDPWL
ncbi:hypothetical protein T484DRAFT_1978347 [Baffinella frigidus]|nr:hypothetical protein T484DRAFT_1978347 [Cryptophyta sp. CCMP2293]